MESNFLVNMGVWLHKRSSASSVKVLAALCQDVPVEIKKSMQTVWTAPRKKMIPLDISHRHSTWHHPSPTNCSSSSYKTVTTDPSFHKWNARRNSFCIIIVLHSKELPQKIFFKSNTLSKVAPCDDCISHSTYWIHKQDLCSNRPYKKPQVARVTNKTVDSMSNKLMIFPMINLDVMRKIVFCSKNSWFTSSLPKNHEGKPYIANLHLRFQLGYKNSLDPILQQPTHHRY